MHRGWRLGFGCAVILSLCTSCTSTSWEWQHRTEFRMPHRLVVWVDVSDQVFENDEEGGVAEFVDTLHRELWRHGYDVTIVASSEGEHLYPRLELLIREWNPGSRALRHLVAGFGGAHIDADCAVRLAPDAAPVFAGRLRGRFDGGSYDYDATAASGAAARELVHAMLGQAVSARTGSDPINRPTRKPAVRPATPWTQASVARPSPRSPAGRTNVPAPPTLALPPLPSAASESPTASEPAVPSKSFPIE